MINHFKVGDREMCSLEFNHPLVSFTLVWDPEFPISRSTTRSIGIDVRTSKTITLPPFSRCAVDTGIRWENVKVDKNYRAGLLMFPRSGLAINRGISQINAVGVIDEDYPDNIGSLIVNLESTIEVKIEKGERIAQLILTVSPDCEALEAITLDAQRVGGFGSTGMV